MAPVVRSRLYDTLLQQSAEIADAWTHRLTTFNAPLNTSQDFNDTLFDITKQIISLTFSDFLDRGHARNIGKSLGLLSANNTVFLGQSQESIGFLLTQNLTPDELMSLFPQLNAVLAEIAIGFAEFAYKGAESQPQPVSDNGQCPEQQITEFKQRFSLLVSHEFRTPMATILAATELIKHYGNRLSETRKYELLDSVHDQIQFLDHLLNDISFVSTAQTFGLKFAPSPVNLEQFVHRAIKHILSKAQISDSRVEFLLRDLAVPAVIDEELFHQIVSRLLMNALLYSPSDSKVYLDFAGDSENIIIHVRDQGIGISEKDQQHIFDAFYRGDNVSFIPGIGLGLTVVKQSVAAHKGTITLSSQEHKGTIFTVSLPLRLRL
jgi:signal transduction histidine kinase